MLYGFGMMYQILDRYAENDIDETEHAFIVGLKWPDSYRLHIRNEDFWEELQKNYDICFTEKDKVSIITIGDLKRKIEECVLYN